MALKDTVKTMHALLDTIKKDLIKAERANKAASQRVRTGTIRLEKIAKIYRKESVTAEKASGPKRKSSAKKVAPTKKKAAKTAKKKKK